MSYKLQTDRNYRMPTHFGRALGPRQGPAGRRYACVDSPKQTIVRSSFEVDAGQLEKYLPEGFTPCKPGLIYLTFSYVTEIEWLAGRGYNTFGVSLPAIYKGQETVTGEFMLVLWENMADPIITGREDLGFSKVYCELPAPQIFGDDLLCRALWDGHQFATLKVSDLCDAEPDNLSDGVPSEGLLHFKYIPKTGSVGEADAAYPVLSPADGSNLEIQKARIAGNAEPNFRKSTWQELPTLVHIIDALSSLEVGHCVEAYVIETIGFKDFSDQRILT